MADPASELAKMELIVLYNTESFDKRDPSAAPIRKESVVKHLHFNPSKRYELNGRIRRGVIEENRSLFQKNTVDFFELELGQLTESPETDLDSTVLIAGSLGLSLDRRQITRTLPSFVDLVAFVGGLALACYLLIYLILYAYQQMEREIHLIRNIFYYNEKLEAKSHEQPLNFKIKAELGSRRRMTRVSLWQKLTCRGHDFSSKIREGHSKLRMRMDIAKFLEDQKFCKVALNALMTAEQQLFCEKQAKQVIRHRSNLRSAYSSDEENQFYDQYVGTEDGSSGRPKNQVGVAVKVNDAFAYVDAMTNRRNPADLRMLGAAINDTKPGKIIARGENLVAGDTRGGV